MAKVAVILAQGFEEIEALTVVDVLRRANISCDMVGFEEQVTGSHDIQVKADRIFDGDLSDYDLVVLPGGMPGSAHLRDNQALISPYFFSYLSYFFFIIVNFSSNSSTHDLTNIWFSNIVGYFV